ncbi:MAG: Asp-tRNA(Asn)/Glu-tRNA(Gln) amidotransferase subunit GatB [Candidatus Eremiobacter antarcticus]|nr:Asp-tRNA(Asn)/Glu-tRNA(Gln) amidotransferase subunit GatC [Candidatus Eremiobacteraeota bacterium]PZR61852.1 MAG: Asp-tRNA(Asn)/Glu-tRNA(Gln) amidotransferase subunit GatB [Candidatus Eremiobacter sp. RRmetagenome_bin22]
MADVPMDINQVSLLARLPLTEEEAQRFAGQFSRLFEFIADLQRLDVSAVHATAQVIPLHNAFREDEIRPSLDREVALENAPDSEGGYFKTPRILD